MMDGQGIIEMDFRIKIADKTIEISSYDETLIRFFDRYSDDSEDKTDFRITIEEKDILEEQKRAGEQQFSHYYLGTLAVLRKLADEIPLHDRILCHGACISFEDQGYLFMAPSGTGKSTHISLWKKYLKDHVDIVNGDKPVLAVEEKLGKIQVTAYGTPWAGKEGWQKNRGVTLCGCCFLKRGSQNRIQRLLPQDCLELLAQQVYIPRSSRTAGRTLELLDLFLKAVPLYLLECDISEEAVRCSFEKMTGMRYEQYLEESNENQRGVCTA